jgi:23S rRNA (pseudouridine1915-N3)-methyltransferase
MKIFLINTGKTKLSYLREGIQIFEKRIRRYIPFESSEIAEGRSLVKYIDKSDYSVLIDERGRQFSSLDFADYIQKIMNRGLSAVYFFTGGADGFSEEVYERADELISLSKMTFTHEMARLIFVEQLYRALTILKGEPYHH